LAWAKVHPYHSTEVIHRCSNFFGASETIAALQAFRKRHAEAQRLQAQYASQPATVDLEHYRSILKNKAIVDDAAKLLREFKPVTYDVNAHIKAIEAFEATAVTKAKETAEKVDIELKDLQATLANIEDARPFEDLTVSSLSASCLIIHISRGCIGRGSWRRAPTYHRGCRDDDQEREMDCTRYISL
jgi:F-type H+-transporting ATPase subunit d